MNKKTSALMMGIALAGLFLALPAQSALLFSDDFDSQTPNEPWVGDSVTGTTPEPWHSTANVDVDEWRVIQVIEDTDDKFGKGTSNQILEYSKQPNPPGGTTGNMILHGDFAGGHTMLTVSFVLYEVEKTHTESSIVYFRQYGDFPGELRGRLSFDQGAFTGGVSYDLNKPVLFHLVINNDGTGDKKDGSGGATLNYSYEGTDRQVAPGMIDVWIDKSYVATVADGGAGNAAFSYGDIKLLRFEQGTSIYNEMYFDDFEVFAGGVIPEPGTGALLGGAALALLAARRRLSRR